LQVVSTGIDTAALDQPGDEGWAYDRAKTNWQRLTRNFAAGACGSGARAWIIIEKISLASDAGILRWRSRRKLPISLA
jgi:hypothetical protein